MVSARSVAGADDMADGIPASGLLDALASNPFPLLFWEGLAVATDWLKSPGQFLLETTSASLAAPTSQHPFGKQNLAHHRAVDAAFTRLSDEVDEFGDFGVD